MELFIKYLLFSFFDSIVCFSIGIFLISFFKINYENNFERNFLALITGVVSIVVITSTIRCDFKTINSFIILVFICFTYRNMNKICYPSLRTTYIFNKENLLYVFFLVIFYCINFIIYYDFEIGDLHSGFINFQDNHFNSNISKCIYESGNENMSQGTNLFFTEQMRGVQPYHYFTEWYNSF